MVSYFTFNVNSGDLFFRGNIIRLTPKESILFYSLLKKHESFSFLSRKELIDAVWNRRGDIINNNNIQQLILQLRRKLKAIENPVIIENVFKRGYRITSPINIRHQPLEELIFADHTVMSDKNLLNCELLCLIE